MPNRYQDLLNAVPKGPFYEADGEILPYRDAPYEFEYVRPDKPNSEFQVSINDVQSAFIETDADGQATVKTPPGLPPGEYVIKITDPIEQISTQIFICIRNTATIHAAIAEVIENDFDLEVDDMRDALSISTVGSKYIESRFGRPVRQPKPTTFLTNDYRRMLQQLRPLYRHFGARPYGVRKAVESITSASPLTVPKSWRPKWVLGHSRFENMNLDLRTRLATPQFSPAGSTDDLPNLNRQSKYWVHPAIDGAVTTGFRDIPVPQKLSVTFADAHPVTLVGYDARGIEVSEVVPGPPVSPASGKTYETYLLYASLTSATKSADTPAQIGLATSRFIAIDELGPYNAPGSLPLLSYAGLNTSGHALLDWKNGTQRPASSSTLELSGIHTYAHIYSVVELNAEAETFSLGDPITERHDRLWLEIDGRGLVAYNTQTLVDDGTQSGAGLLVSSDATVSLDALVIAVNLALTRDTKYGAGYDSAAGTVQGTAGGDTDFAFRIRSFSQTAKGSVRILPGPCDAAPRIFGLPLSTTSLHTAAVSDAATLACVDASKFPKFGPFQIRIRGMRIAASSGTLGVTGLVPTRELRILVTGYSTGVISSTDIGGYVRVSGSTHAANDGLHQIVATDGQYLTLRHEFAHTSSVAAPETGFFDTVIAGSESVTCVVYHSGQIRTVTGVNTAASPDILTISAGVDGPWHAGAIIELVDETPFVERARPGAAKVSLTVDNDYRPYHDFVDTSQGDGIADEGSGNFRLSCTRADFTGCVNSMLTLSNCFNAENNGNFEILSVEADTPSTYAIYANPTGIVEDTVDNTGDIEWSVDDKPTSNSITVIGEETPDQLLVNAATTVTVPNADLGQQFGQQVSRVILTSGTGTSITITADLTYLLREYAGMPFQIAFWLMDHESASGVYTVEISSDGGATWNSIKDAATIAETALLNNSFTLAVTPDDNTIFTIASGVVTLTLAGAKFISNGALPGMSVTLAAADDTGNDGTFELHTVSETVLTFTNASGVANGNDDAVTITINGVPFSGPIKSEPIRAQFWVPADIEQVHTSLLIRLKRAVGVAATATISLDRIIVQAVTHDGLFLGHETLSRSEKREKFGEFLAVWSSDTLTDEEHKYLGLALDGNSIVTAPGHIDYITNSHGYWDRKDVTDSINIVGTSGADDWLALEVDDSFELAVTANDNTTFTIASGVVTLTLAGAEFISNGALPGMFVTLAAAEDAGNNGTFELLTVAANVLTFTNASGVANADDDSVTITINGSSLVQMEPRVGTPDRMSYIRPVRLSLVEGEALVMLDGGMGDGLAVLTTVSNHLGPYPQAPNTGIGTGARLYEIRATATTLIDGEHIIGDVIMGKRVTVIPAGALIPVPDTDDESGDLAWEFANSQQIRINSPYFTPSSTYILDYDVLMRATTGITKIDPNDTVDFDLTKSEYAWVVDFACYERHDTTESHEDREEQAVFSADFTAILSTRANIEDPATLLRDNGLAQTTISQTNWRFTDSKTIAIDSNIFDANSVYTLSYTGRVPVISKPAQCQIEIRQGADEAAVEAATWYTVTNNQVLSPITDFLDLPVSNVMPRYFQFRITVTGIVDVRDLRIYGVGVKGIKLTEFSAFDPEDFGL